MTGILLTLCHAGVHICAENNHGRWGCPTWVTYLVDIFIITLLLFNKDAINVAVTCVIPESEAPSGAKRVGNPDKVDIFLDTRLRGYDNLIGLLTLAITTKPVANDQK
ncbi:MAG: hypothetical protein ABIE07_02710 [Candidatus Zixiibacteriota bacterium]